MTFGCRCNKLLSVFRQHTLPKVCVRETPTVTKHVIDLRLIQGSSRAQVVLPNTKSISDLTESLSRTDGLYELQLSQENNTKCA